MVPAFWYESLPRGRRLSRGTVYACDNIGYGIGVRGNPRPRRIGEQRAGQATFGRCVSKTEWVYGFKVALSVTPEGVIAAFGLAEANSDERPIGEFLLTSDGHDAFLADKGFSSVAWEKHWLEEHGALVAATPQKSARRAWPEAVCRWAAGKRQFIEGVIWQLKDYFGLERHRAKSLGGLLTRLAAKVASYTIGQVLNERLSRPLRDFAELLI
jgi:hypothetical protein